KCTDTDRFVGTMEPLLALAGDDVPSRVNSNRALSAVSWPDGHVEVFMRGAEGDLHQISEVSGAWHKATTVASGVTCGIAAVAPASGTRVFAGTPSGAISRAASSTEDLSCIPLQSLGETGLDAPSAIVRRDGRIDVFARRTDGAIVRDTYDPTKSAWSGFQSLGGAMATGVAAILDASGATHLFATDS